MSSDRAQEELRRYCIAVRDTIAPTDGAAVRASSTAHRASLRRGAESELDAPTSRSEDPLPADRGQVRHRGGLIAAVAACLVVLVVGAAILERQSSRNDSGGDRVDLEVGSVPPAVDAGATFGYAPGWTELDAGPLLPRDGTNVVWTGTELVVLGGRYVQRVPEGVSVGPEPQRGDGAAYDPVRREWRSIAAAPVFLGGYGPAMWSGTEVIVVSRVLASPRDTPRKVAAWNPTTDNWRMLADAPAAIDTDGRGLDQYSELGLVALGDGRLLLIDALSIYDPATDSWSPIADPPGEGAGPLVTDSVVWTGERLVTASEASLTWDAATDTWTVIDSPPTGSRPSSINAAVWNGSHVVFVTTGGSAAMLDPDTLVWRSLPDLPQPSLCDPVMWVQSGVTYVSSCPGVFALRGPDGAESWSEVDLAPPCCEPAGDGGEGVPAAQFGSFRPVVVGDVLFHWYTDDGPRTGFRAWVAPSGDVPPTSSPSSTASDPTIPEGWVTVTASVLHEEETLPPEVDSWAWIVCDQTPPRCEPHWERLYASVDIVDVELDRVLDTGVRLSHVTFSVPPEAARLIENLDVSAVSTPEGPIEPCNWTPDTPCPGEPAFQGEQILSVDDVPQSVMDQSGAFDVAELINGREAETGLFEPTLEESSDVDWRVAVSEAFRFESRATFENTYVVRGRFTPRHETTEAPPPKQDVWLVVVVVPDEDPPGLPGDVGLDPYGPSTLLVFVDATTGGSLDEVRVW